MSRDRFTRDENKIFAVRRKRERVEEVKGKSEGGRGKGWKSKRMKRERADEVKGKSEGVEERRRWKKGGKVGGIIVIESIFTLLR